MMPTYTYQSKDTGEIFSLSMTISEMEKYEQDNPQHERVYHSVNVVDPAGIGVSKPSNDFQKYVLGRIKASTPGATAIGNRRWKIPTEI